MLRSVGMSLAGRSRVNSPGDRRCPNPKQEKTSTAASRPNTPSIRLASPVSDQRRPKTRPIVRKTRPRRAIRPVRPACREERIRHEDSGLGVTADCRKHGTYSAHPSIIGRRADHIGSYRYHRRAPHCEFPNRPLPPCVAFG
jgi:hypothetical protein